METNPKINPSFLKNTTVLLKKDYTKIDPFCSKYLKKGTTCIIIKSGLSQYPEGIISSTKRLKNGLQVKQMAKNGVLYLYQLPQRILKMMKSMSR